MENNEGIRICDNTVSGEVKITITPNEFIRYERDSEELLERIRRNRKSGLDDNIQQMLIVLICLFLSVLLWI